MNERSLQPDEIRQIIAADQRCGEINSQDDQIWELNTIRGEPPGLALQTTYGLRAYGMRVFPRFVFNKIPVSDPHAFTLRPVVEFSAPNFISLAYSPVSPLDVIQKVWVPDSHTLVGQVSLTNNTIGMIQLEMEWVVLLNPLLAGSSMSATQISVNTVLQGQTQHLCPVFFLTGGPQGNLSAFPSLGIELTLQPHATRQFSWALASLESTDGSFYSARKSTAYSLDNEQVKISMLQKQQTLDFKFADPTLEERLHQSQQRVFQLLMPPNREFNHVSYVTNRLPDQGYNPIEKGSEYRPDWGVQRITEIWELSRILPPTRSNLVKDLVQNLLDQQGDDGTIFAQSSWSGNITSLPASPLLVSLVLDLFETTGDLNWLVRIYPALLRSIHKWFGAEDDSEERLYPVWRQLLQTGLEDSTRIDPQTKMDLLILIQTAEWPSLAALLVQECQGLVRIAELIEDDSEIAWLKAKIDQLKTYLQESWDEKQAFYHFRDQESHVIHSGKVLHAFKQNGSTETSIRLPEPARICIKLHPQENNRRPVEVQIKGIVNRHEKTILIPARKFHWEDEQAFAVSDELFSTIKEMTVIGLKKGDLLTVELPNFAFKVPDFMIPLWAGIPTQSQAEKMILQGIEYLESSGEKLPLFLKIMWLEGLVSYNHQQTACRYFKHWFFTARSEPSDQSQPPSPNVKNLLVAGLPDLVPIKTLLQLLSIQKWTEEEIVLKGFNEFLTKVNVQYKQFSLELDATQTRVQDLNGESVIVTDKGLHRIVLS